jgi:hypothetical protein
MNTDDSFNSRIRYTAIRSAADWSVSFRSGAGCSGVAPWSHPASASYGLLGSGIASGN